MERAEASAQLQAELARLGLKVTVYPERAPLGQLVVAFEGHAVAWASPIDWSVCIAGYPWTGPSPDAACAAATIEHLLRQQHIRLGRLFESRCPAAIVAV